MYISWLSICVKAKKRILGQELFMCQVNIISNDEVIFTVKCDKFGFQNELILAPCKSPMCCVSDFCELILVFPRFQAKEAH